MEEKQRQLEERGVAVEKALRGEAGNGLSLDLHTCAFLFLFFSINRGIVFGVMLFQIDIRLLFGELIGVVSSKHTLINILGSEPLNVTRLNLTLVSALALWHSYRIKMKHWLHLYVTGVQPFLKGIIMIYSQ